MHAELRPPPRQLLEHRFAAAGTVTRQRRHGIGHAEDVRRRRARSCSQAGSELVRAAARQAGDRSASQSATSLPTVSWAVRIGHARRMRYSIRAVASRNPSSSRAAIRCGWSSACRTISAASARQAETVSKTRRSAACPLASRGCMPVGRSLTRNRTWLSAPITRADLPRISSRTSGLRFCGMIEEPVVRASGSLRKPNSVENQMIHSVAQPQR